MHFLVCHVIKSSLWLYLIQQFSQLDIFSITSKRINQYGRGQGRMQEPPVNQDILKTLYSTLANMTNKIDTFFFGNLYHCFFQDLVFFLIDALAMY
jgi:hypothetical protein